MSLINIGIGSTGTIASSGTDDIQFQALGTLDVEGIATTPIDVTLSSVAGIGLLDTINVTHAHVTLGGVAGVSALMNYDLGTGGTLDIASVADVALGTTITFAAPTARLELASGITLPLLDAISGYAPGNVIDVAGTIASDSYADNPGNDTGGVLTLYNNGGIPVETLDFSNGNFSLANFQLARDQAGGTEIENPCFAAGTLILTDRGEIPVENLSIGDRLPTWSGTYRVVRWIGLRSYDGKFIGGNRNILPIVIQPDAISDGVPKRKLVVSPKHAMFLDGVLIPAELLVNGATIVQVASVKTTLTYYHIELDVHDILFADGAPAESFIDHDSRMMFQNAAEFYVLQPAPLPQQDCAVRIDDGELLDAARRRIATRAGLAADHLADAVAHGEVTGRIDVVDCSMISGWAFDGKRPHTPIHVELIIDGKPSGICTANRFRADLRAAGKSAGRCEFVFRLKNPLSDAAHVIEVRRVEDGAVFAQARLAATSVHPGPLEGRMDACNESTVEGWAIDRESPEVPVRLEILQGDQVVGETLANRFRPDLHRAGFGGGHCSFIFAFDSPPAHPSMIWVRRVNDRVALAASRTELAA